MALRVIATKSLFLGKCVPSAKENASKICIKTMDFDSNLNMYFDKMEFVYAHDPEMISKTGDIVLIQKLAEKLTMLIEYKVKEVVYPLGDITDPITGKKVVAHKYRDDVQDTFKRFGLHKRAFDYDKAPPRGWQEDKKDFSNRETYIKYDANDDTPYAV